MASSGISRRVLVGLLGSGVLVAPTLARAFPGAPQRSPDASSPPPSDLAARLLAPLTVGSRFGRWTVAAIQPLARGAVTVALSSESAPDHVFFIEILARDPSPLAVRPPAETRDFALFVKNGGDGYSPTHEEQGLSAMALAQILAANEEGIDARGFLTHAARIAQHHEELMVLDEDGAEAGQGPRWHR